MLLRVGRVRHEIYPILAVELAPQRAPSAQESDSLRQPTCLRFLAHNSEDSSLRLPRPCNIVTWPCSGDFKGRSPLARFRVLMPLMRAGIYDREHQSFRPANWFRGCELESAKTSVADSHGGPVLPRSAAGHCTARTRSLSGKQQRQRGPHVDLSGIRPSSDFEDYLAQK
jgi:hypothetical protein